jgi:hypothetical protein
MNATSSGDSDVSRSFGARGGRPIPDDDGGDEGESDAGGEAEGECNDLPTAATLARGTQCQKPVSSLKTSAIDVLFMVKNPLLKLSEELGRERILLLLRQLDEPKRIRRYRRA